MIEVTVQGVTYNNVRSAWRAVSPARLPEITVRKRLKAGWEPDIAFLLPSIPPSLRRLGRPVWMWSPEDRATNQLV